MAIMKLQYLSYEGPQIDDIETLEKLPADLRNLLQQINGFIQFEGGLHIRGACSSPEWHSLAGAWTGENALWRLFPSVEQTDVPFGQDALGDQFLLRDGSVYRLQSETGYIESLQCGFYDFLEAAQLNAVKFLSLEPLIQFLNDNGVLLPGQMLSAYPPFCTTNAKDGVSLRAISSQERIAFLASFAAQTSSLPDGTAITIKVVD
jgi:hypothetical protein